MNDLQHEILDDALPPAACTKAMRNEVREMAQEYGVSNSAVVRAAVRFFLDEKRRKSTIEDSNTTESVVTV